MILSHLSMIRLVITFAVALLLTPIIRKLAFLVGAIDEPNQRRVNKKPMPTMGGLAIYLTFIASGYIFFHNVIPIKLFTNICIGALIIIITGILDDIYELSPKQKMFGIILASCYIYFFAEIKMTQIQILGLGVYVLPEWLSFGCTLLWIAIFTNSINLIDGLDGLAGGVSLISLITIGIIALFHFQGSLSYIAIFIFILAAAIFGFLPYNFYPAKIYLGDTGALFLGFMISIFSLMGLKNATLITFFTPFVILGVPIADTFFAIIRRKLNRKPISSADKRHLHHCLISLGFTHRGAVIIIYGLSIFFSIVALIYNYLTSVAVLTLSIALLFCIELFVEMIGLIDPKYTPLLHVFKFIGNKAYRKNKVQQFKDFIQKNKKK